MTNSLSQYGITWTFDKELIDIENPSEYNPSDEYNEDYYTYGRYANGDYWVVGPVNIIEISPQSVLLEGRIINGSMLNPTTGTFNQGFDSSATGYVESLNVAYDSVNGSVSSEHPLIISVDKLPYYSALHSTISIIEGFTYYYLSDCAILTIVKDIPAIGQFRPPYCQPSKGEPTIFNSSCIDLTILKNLEYPTGINSYYQPKITGDASGTFYAPYNITRWFERPWIDFNTVEPMMYYHPLNNMKSYGAYLSDLINTAIIMLNINYSDELKMPLTISMIQLGIDFYGIIQTSRPEGTEIGWPGEGGLFGGRKISILFAGIMLNSDEMKNIGIKSGDYINSGSYGPDHHTDEDIDAHLRCTPPPDYIAFGEDDQTFYVNERDNYRSHVDGWLTTSGSSEWYPDYRDVYPDGFDLAGQNARIPYEESDYGLPEWGIAHGLYPGTTNKWLWTSYRSLNIVPFISEVIAALIMTEFDANGNVIGGMKHFWNHDALFDYADRIKIFTDPGTYWAASTEYNIGDEVYDYQTGTYCYICINAHTSSSTFSNDINNWDIIEDIHPLTLTFGRAAYVDYRADYGPIWPNTVENPSYENPSVFNEESLTGSSTSSTSSSSSSILNSSSSSSLSSSSSVLSSSSSISSSSINSSSSSSISSSYSSQTIIYLPNPSIEDLVLYYNFNTQPINNEIIDLSGYNNDGTFVKCTWFPYFLRFDGLNSYIKIPMNDWNVNQGTISLWCLFNSFSSTSYLFGHTSSAPVYLDRIQLYLTNDSFCIGIGDTHFLNTDIYTFNLNVSYHVSLTWNYNKYNVYVNGYKIDDGSSSGLTTLGSTSDIGNNGGGDWIEGLDGYIDDFRVYNYTLSPQEIYELANENPSRDFIENPSFIESSNSLSSNSSVSSSSLSSSSVSSSSSLSSSSLSSSSSSISSSSTTLNPSFEENPSWEELHIYSRGSVESLPSGDANLPNIFTAQEYLDIENDNNKRIPQSTVGGYSMFLFKEKNDKIDSISLSWNGRSDRAPSSSTVYLQIYNRNSLTWETLDSDNTTNSNIDFTLSSNVLSNLSFYFDDNYWISWRIYQQAV